MTARPLRIVYSFPHTVGRAGIGTTAFNQLRGAIGQGLDVDLYCTSLESDLPGLRSLVETMRVGGRRVPHRLVGVDRAYRLHDRRVAAALRRRDEVFDLVHAWPRASLATFAAAHEKGIPCLREVPNTHTAFAFEAVMREHARLGLSPADGHSHTYDREILEQEEAEYRLADILLMPSEFARRTFVDQGVPSEKLVLHRYGFDDMRFPAAQDDDTTTGGLRAVFVGSCEPRKGLHHALEAWIASGAADHGRFTICGSFTPGYREAVADLLAHPSVEVRGFVDDPSELMRQSHIFLLPSIEEGSALVTYEAQASGCVLVVSDAAGARFDHGRQGLMHRAGDVPTLTSHLRTLNEDRELLGRLRRATLAGRSELTWDRAAAELAEVYRAAARSGLASGARGASIS